MTFQQPKNKSFLSKIIVSGVILIIAIFARDPIVYVFRGIGLTWYKPILEFRLSLLGGVKKDYAKDTRDARIIMLESENSELKKSLGHKLSSNAHLSLVLSSLLSSPYDTLILDQGSLTGIKHNDKVTTIDGIALGEIVEVYPSESKVQLYSAYGRKSEFALPDSTRVVVSGIGGENYQLKLPNGLKIDVGTYLELPSSLHLIAAVVEHIDKNSENSFQTILARIPTNINSLRSVYVWSEQ